LDLTALHARIAALRGAAQRGVAVLPLRRKLAVLGVLAVMLLGGALWLAWAEYREAHFGEGHLAAAAEMRMLSQRLAKAALRGLRGDADAFPQIQASRDDFAAALARLARDARAPQAIERLGGEWARTEKDATLLLRDQKLLVALAAAAARLERANPQLLERAERVQNLKLAQGALPAEVAAASRLVMLTQRLARGAQHLVTADQVEPEIEFLLGKDVNEFRGTLARLRAGARDDELVAALEALGKDFGPVQDAVVAVLGTRERLAGAKAAAFAIHADSERLLEAVDRVVAAYRAAPSRVANEAGLAAIALALVAALLLLALFYVVDERRGREAAARRLAVLRRHHERDLDAVEQLRRDLEALGPVLEEEAIELHLIAMSSKPPIFYWKPGTVQVLERLRGLQVKYPELIGDVRGLGLMLGVEFVADRVTRKPAKRFTERLLHQAYHNGLLLLSCGVSTLRLMPPLMIDRAIADEAMALLDTSIGQALARSTDID